VTALKDQWQEQRLRRQQELAERQQQVREALASFQQERSTKASQLRDDLSLFRLELQQGTQTFLTDVSKQRQLQAEELAHFLRNFNQDLQVQTADFLRLIATDRSLMAQELAQNLSRFHNHLSQSVSLLRQALQARMQELQAEVAALQADTQKMLQLNHQERLQNKIQLMQELAAFTESLQNNVQTYLAELELVRQDRAQKLQQMLQSDRHQRQLEMDAIFQELSDFRAELRQFCTDLRTSVWGGVETAFQVVQPTVAQAPVTQPAVAPIPAAPVQPIESNVPPVPATPTSTAASASAPTSPSKLQPETSAPVVTTGQPSATASPSTEETLIMENSEAITPKTVQKDAAQLEKEIYHYIHEIKGARLNEIESTLDINRFQAVDALRSLIKKGLITQRDRIYLIQEEANL
jgi:hypothetical protein